MPSVAVLGGGIGGLSAAMELAERGFDVTVYESRPDFGGKARSMPVPDSGTDGRDDLPAEHGFRFFPGFYRHVPNTMSRIPHGDGTVLDHLVAASRVLIAQADGRDEIIGIAQIPSSLADVGVALRFLSDIAGNVGVPPLEIAAFAERMLTLLCSCDERRLGQWELTSWWEFVDAENRSEEFKKFLADGMTRSLVAARATEMSARTGGLILWQLLFDLVRADGRFDRVLDGPTNEVWIDPWVAHLKGLGVDFRAESEVAGIDCDQRRITGITIADRSAGTTELIVADHYVSALPVERFRRLLSRALRAAEPRLSKLPRLEVRWMNGAMFYLADDVELVHGHAVFIDSDWALTAISQKQFWPDVDLTQRGDGTVNGILSVDISDWERPSRRTGLVASACTKEQIREEVWAQIVDHIDDGSLDEDNVVTWFLDSAIVFPNPSKVTNLEPLLVNTAGSWADRPDASTRIPNLYFAADFVRTNTDLATMEGANEAARRAVNAILDATGSTAPRCQIWQLDEPAPLAAIRRVDQLRWRLGRGPVTPPIALTVDGVIEATNSVVDRVLGFARRFV